MAAHGLVRLVFVGRHRLWFVGRIQRATGSTAAVGELDLLVAQHSRIGNVTQLLGDNDGLTALLTPGDTVTLSYRATEVPAGKVRDYFLVSKGVYTSTPPPANQEAVQPDLPREFALAQNQPNPFSASTAIHFALPRSSQVQLEIFDLQGRRIDLLRSGEMPAGNHVVEWDRRASDGTLTPPGVYLYRLRAGEFVQQRKMVLLAR
jgi:hypothetical protein